MIRNETKHFRDQGRLAEILKKCVISALDFLTFSLYLCIAYWLILSHPARLTNNTAPFFIDELRVLKGDEIIKTGYRKIEMTFWLRFSYLIALDTTWLHMRTKNCFNFHLS